jgi:signal peptide peptidase SppA
MDTTPYKIDRLIRFVSQQPWAILPSTLAIMRDVLRLRASGLKLSAEELAERIGARGDVSPRGSQAPTAIAVIPVWGIVGHRANELQDVSSRVGTSTEILASYIAAAVTDPSVQSIVLDVNSPGGGVYGVAELADFIRSQRGKKPIVAVANALAASAAYWIASAASEVVVTPSGQVGSIGVFSLHEDVSQQLAEEGVNVTLIRAGRYKAEDAPFGPLTDEARAAMQGQVDSYYAMFVRDVAKGRGVAVDVVRDGFGEGRVVNAKDALAAGMVDRVATMGDVLGGLMTKSPAMSAVESPRIAAEAEAIAEIEAEPRHTRRFAPTGRRARKPPTSARGGCDCASWNSREHTTPRAATVTR